MKSKSLPITKKRLFLLSAGEAALPFGFLYAAIAIGFAIAAAAYHTAFETYLICMAFMLVFFFLIVLMLSSYAIRGLLFLGQMEKRLNVDFNREMENRRITRTGNAVACWFYADDQWFVAVSGVYLHVLHRDTLNLRVVPDTSTTRDRNRITVNVPLKDGGARTMQFLVITPRAARAFTDWHKALREKGQAM